MRIVFILICFFIMSCTDYSQEFDEKYGYWEDAAPNGNQNSNPSTGSASSRCPDGKLCDLRDGNLYSVVTIGSQTWTSENMRYKTSYSQCYMDDSQYCKDYGRMYPIDELQRVCPDGWHVPSREEWEILFDYVGNHDAALKSTTGWYDRNNGSDTYGFNAKPFPNVQSGIGVYMGYVRIWSSTECGNSAFSLDILNYENSDELAMVCSNDGKLRSVRCLKNDETYVSDNNPVINQIVSSSSTFAKGSMIDSRDGRLYKTVSIGGQNWFAENLHYTGGRSSKFGVLYSWDEAYDGCPVGWHLPTSNDWSLLFENVGGISKAEYVLKSKDGWEYADDGTDKYGFGVLPDGCYNCAGLGYDTNSGSSAWFWTSTEIGSQVAYAFLFRYTSELLRETSEKKSYFSVRCVED